MSTRRLQLHDMDAAARVHRAAFDHALPWLTGLHTPEEDRWFYRERMFKTCTLWGAFDGDAMTGIIAFHDDWIEQLYVLPEAFQRNARARGFYQARGFVLAEQTDGAGNEEKEPDARYLWTRGQDGR